MATRWFRKQDGQEVGPTTFQDLAGMIRAGTLREDDKVRAEHGSNWIAARDVVGLLRAAGVQPAESAPPAPSRAAAPGPRKRSRPWGLFVLLYVLATLFFAVRVFRPDWLGRARWAETVCDFRDPHFDIGQLRTVGPPRHVSRDEQGLKLSVPAGKSDTRGALRARNQIVGDFEVTARFEIIDAPPETGATLFIQNEDGTRGASLQCIRRADGARVLIAHHHGQGEDGSHGGARPFPSGADSGSLRITRKGPAFGYWFAEGASRDFREIYSFNFTSQPMAMAQVCARVRDLSDRPVPRPTAVTVRFSDLVIRAERILDAEQEPPVSLRPYFDRAALALLAAFPLALGCIAWRKRKRAHVAPEGHAEKGGDSGTASEGGADGPAHSTGPTGYL